ncbi:hypothetical protein PYW07_011795 [Mythimna separata]|uniref:C2H2-type domain-containing protein n=1 Tax=Mythimna separata TaxID=271217 RepID=A0AAD7Y772_MYTSE|nr:hypothetical protein PYW07_011795 [Mythimna separata]
MTYSCSRCTFTAQFESALKMHRQLHHDVKDTFSVLGKTNRFSVKKANTVPRSPSLSPTFSHSKTNVKETKSLSRSSSATRLLDKLRARICKSRTLFSHPEEDSVASASTVNDPGGAESLLKAESSQKSVKAQPSMSLAEANVDKLLNEKLVDDKETFGCHLCSFDADRITALDRHLLNHHKIGLENLLKLVMAKTKDGLSEDAPNMALYGVRQPYYRLQDEILEEGEFIIETVSPKIKILKHAATNTEIQWSDIPDLKNNCRMISAELEKLIKYPLDKCDKDDFMVKMQTLNECMCKFVDSSNTLKKVLAKEFDSKHAARERSISEQPFFDLCLGDNRNTPRVNTWDRAHSEQMDSRRSRYGDNNKSDKFSAESFYF